jgi:hypothetical protein
MAQQTAVEWLIEWSKENPIAYTSDYIAAKEKALQMEKEQIMNAFNWAANEQASNRELDLSAAEVYYNKKYKQ